MVYNSRALNVRSFLFFFFLFLFYFLLSFFLLQNLANASACGLCAAESFMRACAVHKKRVLFEHFVANLFSMPMIFDCFFAHTPTHKFSGQSLLKKLILDIWAIVLKYTLATKKGAILYEYVWRLRVERRFCKPIWADRTELNISCCWRFVNSSR